MSSDLSINYNRVELTPRFGWERPVVLELRQVEWLVEDDGEKVWEKESLTHINAPDFPLIHNHYAELMDDALEAVKAADMRGPASDFNLIPPSDVRDKQRQDFQVFVVDHLSGLYHVSLEGAVIGTVKQLSNRQYRHSLISQEEYLRRPNDSWFTTPEEAADDLYKRVMKEVK